MEHLKVAVSSVLAGVINDEGEISEIVTSLADCCETSSVAKLARAAAQEECFQRTAIKNFVMATVPSYSLSEFKFHFRMGRSCFEVRPIWHI